VCCFFFWFLVVFGLYFLSVDLVGKRRRPPRMTPSPNSSLSAECLYIQRRADSVVEIECFLQAAAIVSRL